MKYFTLVVFNLLALIVLWAFFFPGGGLMDSLEKMDRIALLEYDKAKSLLELEEMKSRLYQLKTMDQNDPRYLAHQGRKADGTVIFRINNPDSLHQLNVQFHRQREFLRFRLFVMLGIVVFCLLLGNILLVLKKEA